MLLETDLLKQQSSKHEARNMAYSSLSSGQARARRTKDNLHRCILCADCVEELAVGGVTA
jgi:hypothetical protein